MADIRSFFAVKSKTAATASTSKASTTNGAKAPTKKRRANISSDEDETAAAASQNKNSSPKPDLKKLKKISTANSDGKKRSATAATAISGGKAVDISAAFSDENIVRIERAKPKPKSGLDAHFDEDFDNSLAEIDSSVLEESTSKNGDAKRKPKLEKASIVESPSGTDVNDVMVAETGIKSPIKTKTPVSARKTSKSTKPTKPSSDNLNDSVQTDEERFEKKRMAAALYQQFKNRGGPPNPGSKELPNGNPTCLANLTFIITGVLDSMERDEAADLIRAHGGKITSSLSKKTSYMVVGEDAGLAKLAKADELKTNILSEDDLLKLIRKKSGLKDVETINGSQPKRSPAKAVKREIKCEESSPPKKVPKMEKASSPKKNNRDEAKKQLPKTEIKKEPLSSPKKTNGEAAKAISTPEIVLKTETHSDCLSVNRVQTEHERNINSVENQAWVEKYKPTSVKQIIGQQGANSNVAKLTNWLSKWYINQNSGKKPARPNPWAKNDDGAFYKAALLSGPPGVGKTTTATLVSQELGFDVVEFNASDTRSKRLLKEEVSELLSNKSLYGYFRGTKDAVTVKHVLLMDEVDGMAGNEDRGGMQELIALIRDSSVPVICMCNDRNHQKMRSLVNYCYDLRFARPQVGQIKGAMMSIIFKEGFKLAPSVLEEVISATNNDIRQTLNHLTLMSASGAAEAKLSAQLAAPKGATKHHQQTARKDLKLGPWEVVRKVFSAEEHRGMTLADKADLFFHDYSLGPLFVQQNYLHVAPNVPKAQIPMRVAMAADSLSRGDLIESRIRSKMAWSMLPVQAMFSSVMPGEYMSGTITGQIQFPGWLGKYSKSNKRNRMAQEIHDHTRVRTSGSRLSVRLDYAGFLIAAIARPLRERGVDGIDESLTILREYHLLREDIDSLLELSTWPGQKNAFDGIDGRVKAALTRAYNKDIAPYAYSAASAVKTKKASSAEADDGIDAYGDGNGTEDQDGNCGGAGVASDEEDEPDTNVENDVLIKAKKAKDSSSTAKKSTTTAKNGTTAAKGRLKATKSK